MSNPFKSKAESTGASKMAKTSGSSKNYESAEKKAGRRYADGGEVSSYRPRTRPTPQMQTNKAAYDAANPSVESVQRQSYSPPPATSASMGSS